mmetsp:Transcript_17475/g.26529  ORF Transcript_17475/g.26529 Transcript_17475/m.26529 type:complete len:119 (-) Transcript_17475:494-850(-)
MQSIDATISIRIGKKRFTTNEELREAVRKYCEKRAEELVTTYGWPIGKCDVSQVSDFSRVFESMHCFDEDISNWDVSNGTTFYSMFSEAESFNQDIGLWDVTNATSLRYMFCDAVPKA